MTVAMLLCRFRGGHAAPPTIVQHYGAEGTRLLSAGAAGQGVTLLLFTCL